MQVIEFLKANSKAFSKLTEAFGIKVKEYHDPYKPSLYVLNYDQINSPKTDPVVQECRGLILDGSLNIICRPFDRFFNLGEAGTDDYDFSGYTFHPKLDGSLIKVYHWYGMWRIATRGTAFAESQVGDHSITFEQLTLKAFDCKSLAEFDDMLLNKLQFNTAMTYLFELTAPENRVVTPYTEASMTLLAVRENNTGKYFPTKYVASFGMFKHNKAEEGYTIQDIVKKADSLKNLEEGFVGYDKHGVPQVKVKSAAYVKIHYLRSSTSLTKKSVCGVIATGEMEEYLTYYPEDSKYFKDILESWDKHLKTLSDVFEKMRGLDSQKDFAIAVKDLKCCGLLFEARKKGVSVTDVFVGADVDKKVKLMMEVV